MKIVIRTMLSLLLVLPFAANADPVELIVNGEFEDPTIETGYAILGDGSLPGWSCQDLSGAVCELWQQNFLESPIYGSDGIETGQHLELSSNSLLTIVSQANVAAADGTATLSFDYWDRTGSGVIELAIIIANSTVFSSSYVLNDGSNGGKWWNISIPDITLGAGQIVELQFFDSSFNGSGAHIDGVSLLTYAVPEPGTLGLLGLGLLGLGFRGQRKTAI